MPRLPKIKPWPRGKLPPEVARQQAAKELDGTRASWEPTEAERALEVVAPGSCAPNGQIEPWGPQPLETAQEYEAFRLWLDSGADVPRVELSKRWRWAARKQAFESCVGHVSLGSPTARADMSLRAVQAIKRLAMVEAAKLLAQAETQVHPSMTARECARVLKDAIMLERLLDGLTTENVGVQGGALDGMSDQEFAQLSAWLAERKK